MFLTRFSWLVLWCLSAILLFTLLEVQRVGAIGPVQVQILMCNFTYGQEKLQECVCNQSLWQQWLPDSYNLDVFGFSPPITLLSYLHGAPEILFFDKLTSFLIFPTYSYFYFLSLNDSDGVFQATNMAGDAIADAFELWPYGNGGTAGKGVVTVLIDPRTRKHVFATEGYYWDYHQCSPGEWPWDFPQYLPDPLYINKSIASIEFAYLIDPSIPRLPGEKVREQAIRDAYVDSVKLLHKEFTAENISLNQDIQILFETSRFNTSIVNPIVASQQLLDCTITLLPKWIQLVQAAGVLEQSQIKNVSRQISTTILGTVTEWMQSGLCGVPGY